MLASRTPLAGWRGIFLLPLQEALLEPTRGRLVLVSEITELQPPGQHGIINAGFCGIRRNCGTAGLQA